jgi:hypothetical protein
VAVGLLIHAKSMLISSLDVTITPRVYRIIKHYGQANHRREKPVAPSFTCGGDTPEGVVPGVPGKRELADMARKQGICPAGLVPLVPLPQGSYGCTATARRTDRYRGL